ncbi:MAG TPA: Do family serine endopeptidase [Burkholderiales bacterium]|nr:Do family serine endopeptidase [Burkholderiales bacterium]
MRKLWLIFAQTTTICLAILFVVSTLRPDLLGSTTRASVDVVTTREAAVAPSRAIASYSDAARKAMPTVVNIYTSKESKVARHPFMDDPVFRYFFGEQFDAQTRRSSSLGSGVIVSDKGYILTNHHVVEAADEIEVALADARRAKAKVVGSDPDTDLAVLKLDLKNLPSVTFAQSEQARVGDVVLAIGNPFGVGQTVTSGIISALGRSHLGINTFENFIQTDAAINPGNSGGALVDVNGNLIGINSAIYTRTGGSQGIGFAIPSSLARQVMEQIIETGTVTRGWVGIGVQDLTAELADTLKLPKVAGALITEVVNASPADKAGLKPGDVLTGVEGKSVTDYSSTLNLISALKPGNSATLKVMRDKKEFDVKVGVGLRPKPRRDAGNKQPG